MLNYIITDNDGRTMDQWSLLLWSEACNVWEAHYCNASPFYPCGIGMFGGTFPGPDAPLTDDERVLTRAEIRQLGPDVRKFFALALKAERAALAIA